MTDAPAATAAKAVAGALIRHAITAAGGILVAKGYVDAETAGAAVGPISDCVLGAVLTGLGSSLGILRARLMHSRWVQAWVAPARALPSSLTAPAEPASKE